MFELENLNTVNKCFYYDNWVILCATVHVHISNYWTFSCQHLLKINSQSGMQLSFAQGVNWISVFKLLKYTYTFIRTLKSCMQPFKVGAIWKQAEINANIIETVSNWSRVAIMETENLNCLRRILHSYVEFWVQFLQHPRVWAEKKQHSPNLIIWKSQGRTRYQLLLCTVN